jgi:amidophosphoribosyltransferase
MDQLRDGPGWVAAAGQAKAARTAASGVLALRHHQAGGAGIAAVDGGQLRVHQAAGALEDVIGPEQLLALPGRFALGQLLPPAAPSGALRNGLHPGDRLAVGRVRGARLAVSLVGRVTNAFRLREDLSDRGAVLLGTSDAELVLHLVAHSAQKTLVNRLVDALWRLEGAWSLALLAEDRLVIARDPHGFRPVWIGRVDDGWIAATEDAALRETHAEARREVGPGEMAVFDARGMQSVQPLRPLAAAACAQQVLQLAPAEGRPFGASAWGVRTALGERLAADCPAIEADRVVALAGAEAIGHGFAARAGLRLVPAWSAARAIAPAVEDGRVALVVAGLATGIEVRAAVLALREAGASRVDVRVGAPATTAGCRYGVPGPTSDEIASRPESDLPGWLGADSVGILGHAALLAALGRPGAWCTACIGGRQPIAADEGEDQLPLFAAAAPGG